jgi:acyl-homoserine-lactone acylase
MAKLMALDLKNEPDLLRAQQLLATWDWNSDSKGRADALGESMMHMANSAAYHGEPLPDAKAKLREVVDSLMKGFGRLDMPLSELQRLRRGTVDLPANGGTDTLRAATSWEPLPDGRMRVKHGDSFVMLVTWDKAGKVESRSIQPYGAATTRSDSPHYIDQMALFAARKFKPVHFDRGDIIRHAKHAYRP